MPTHRPSLFLRALLALAQKTQHRELSYILSAAADNRDFDVHFSVSCPNLESDYLDFKACQ